MSPVLFMRVGGGFFVGGLLSYFFNHSVLLAAIISGFGYLLFMIGLIGWSLERNGDVSFS
jgi:hypothetical protein